jgi:phospholipid/cholesterol/gamma-HCH transport system ATP-binding protein
LPNIRKSSGYCDSGQPRDPGYFFISNRILALYDRRIFFQGTPEELEAFERPFKEDVIQSIEGLEEELTGLYSRRYFKTRYQIEVKLGAFRESYAIVVFKDNFKNS